MNYYAPRAVSRLLHARRVVWAEKRPCKLRKNDFRRNVYRTQKQPRLRRVTLIAIYNIV